VTLSELDVTLNEFDDGTSFTEHIPKSISGNPNWIKIIDSADVASGADVDKVDFTLVTSSGTSADSNLIKIESNGDIFMNSEEVSSDDYKVQVSAGGESSETATTFTAKVECLPYDYDHTVVKHETHGIPAPGETEVPELGVPVDVYKAFPPSVTFTPFLEVPPKPNTLSDRRRCPVTYNLWKQFGDSKINKLNWIDFETEVKDLGDGPQTLYTHKLRIDDNRVKTQLVQWTVHYGPEATEVLRGKIQATVIDGVEPEYVYSPPTDLSKDEQVALKRHNELFNSDTNQPITLEVVAPVGNTDKDWMEILNFERDIWPLTSDRLRFPRKYSINQRGSSQ